MNGFEKAVRQGDFDRDKPLSALENWKQSHREGVIMAVKGFLSEKRAGKHRKRDVNGQYEF